jgi:Na+-translocating ferredoxin:NAD+ oxidoreductase RnfD subunit
VHVAWAVGGAVVVDLVAGWATGKDPRRWPSSALLSGLIVAFVLGVETPGLVAAAVGAIASASKYVFRSRRGHVFNPAGLALLAAVPLFAAGESWWGAFGDMAAPWMVLLLAVGLLTLDKVKKWPMALSFLGALYGVFTVLSLGSPSLVAEMYRAPFVQSSLFLAFFMLTDPPTSPGKESDQVWMGALAGLVAAAAQLAGAGQVYLLLGLLAVNVALTLQRWLADRRRPLAGGGSAVDLSRGTGQSRVPLAA